MKFGMRDTFALCVEPLASSAFDPPPADSEHWAEVSVWVAGENLTRSVDLDSGFARESLALPLEQYAMWWVRSWPSIAVEECQVSIPVDGAPHQARDLALAWIDADFENRGHLEDAFDAWRRRHFLRSTNAGLLLPDIAFQRDSEWLIVSDRPHRTVGARRWEFTSRHDRLAVPWQYAHQTVRDFLDWAASELVASEDVGAPAEVPNHALRLNQLSLSEYIGLMSTSVEESQRLLKALDDKATLERPSLLALRDLSGVRISEEVLHVLTELDAKSTQSDKSQMAEDWRSGLADFSSPTPAEEGYALARAFRSRVGLVGSRMPSERLEAVLQTMANVDSRSVDEHQVSFVAGSRSGYKATATLFERPSGVADWTRRMQYAKVVCHLLVDDQGAPVSGCASARGTRSGRNKRAGAFAAELLAPAAAIKEVLGGRGASTPGAFEDVMSSFGIGATTAANQLWNHRLVSSRSERDELLHEFASKSPYDWRDD